LETLGELSGNSQNFLRRILYIFVTLGLKILILLRIKEDFETLINIDVNTVKINQKVPIFYE